MRVMAGPVHSSGRRYEYFASEYVRTGFNGQQAVLNCGFTKKPKSAKIIAHRLLTYVTVAEAVKRHMETAKMSADEVLQELSEVAKTKTKIGGGEKLKALELLGKGHKLFTEKVETLTTEGDSAIHLKSILSEQISLIADDDAIPQSEAEYRLQSRLADRSRKSYSDKYDPRLHPELFPSGCVVPLIIQQIEGEQ